jgi:hypothetical protein
MQHACESVAGGGTPAHTAHRTGPARTGGARGSGTPRSHELYTKYFFEAKCTLVLSEMATPTHETAAVGHGPQLSSRTELNTQDTESDVWAVGSGQAVRLPLWAENLLTYLRAASAHRTLRFRRYNVKEFGVPAGGNEAGRVVG